MNTIDNGIVGMKLHAKFTFIFDLVAKSMQKKFKTLHYIIFDRLSVKEVCSPKNPKKTI